MAVCNNHLPFPGFSLEDKANSVGQGIDIPLRSIVVNLRIKSRIDCLVVLFRCISVSINTILLFSFFKFYFVKLFYNVQYSFRFYVKQISCGLFYWILDVKKNMLKRMSYTIDSHYHKTNIVNPF